MTKRSSLREQDTYCDAMLREIIRKMKDGSKVERKAVDE